MTPFGHLAVGYLISQARRDGEKGEDIGGYLFGSVWPDLDFLLMYMLPREKVHRISTHSPLAAFMAARVCRCGLGFWPMFLGTLFHIIVDDLWGAEHNPGVGWLFPFAHRRISLLPDIQWPTRLGRVAIPRRYSSILVGEMPVIAVALLVWLATRPSAKTG